MALDLSDVTLCAADSVHMPLTARAMHHSMEGCTFADAILYSHEPVAGSFRTVHTKKLSFDDYQTFRLNPPAVKTPFTLWIEWDGYITDPRAWHPSFREYDYIGAKWPLENANGVRDSRTVGNSGFCLQSRTLNEALNDPRFMPAPGENVDMLICKKYRAALERDYGIRFAPEPIADLFSYELSLPRQATFGFHSLSNMWRHNDDTVMIEIANSVDPYVLSSSKFAMLILNYSMVCKYAVAEKLFTILLKQIPRDEAIAVFRHAIKQPHADALFNFCEQLAARP
jgi:hypothetical protein